MLRHLQGDVSTLAEEVARRSDGNPFYAEEIIRDLVDRGVVRIADTTRWLLVGNADTIEVPSTVEGVLHATRPPPSKALQWCPHYRPTTIASCPQYGPPRDQRGHE